VREYKIGQIVPLDYQRTIIGEPLDKPTWFALNTPPQRERIAREMLKAKGIHACYPEREKSWKVRGSTSLAVPGGFAKPVVIYITSI
jgi:hypothetical protein